MAHATGLRLLAALCFLLSLSIILAPVFLPLGFLLMRKANQTEREKEELQEALKDHVDQD